MHDVIRGFAGRLIVSCQARPGSPLRRPSIMAAMARAAELGGAAGIRANGAPDIAAIRRAVSLPIIGIVKVERKPYPVYITPTVHYARPLIRAGAGVIAVDAT